MLDVLVAIGDHGAALVPAAAAHDVHGVGAERVRAAHNRTDVHIVLPVFDRHVKQVPLLVEVVLDRLGAPVAVPVDHVAGVAVLEQFGIEVLLGRPYLAPAGPRTNARGAAFVAWFGGNAARLRCCFGARIGALCHQTILSG